MQNVVHTILTKKQILQKINRIAHEIHEKNFQEKELVFVGIDPMGFHFMNLLIANFKEIAPHINLTIGKLQLDKDTPLQGNIKLSLSNEEIENKVIIIFDDVLKSGRTVAYALKPFLNCSIKKLQTAVIVDRGYKNFPIAADYVGYALATTLKEHVNVILDNEEKMGAYLY